MSRATARGLFVLAVSALFLYVTSPLFMAVAAAAVLAVIFYPLQARLQRRKVSSSVASGALTFLITVLLLVPGGFLIFIVAKAGLEQLQDIDVLKAERSGGEAQISFLEDLLDLPKVERLINGIASWFPVTAAEIRDAARDLGAKIALGLADALGTLVSHLPAVFMALAVVVVSVYFFLVDGPKLVAFARKHSFLSPSETDRLLAKSGLMCRSVVLAFFVSGAAQAVVFAAASLIVGAPNVALVGFLVFVSSFIPLVGSLPVTLAVAGYQLIVGNTAEGIVLAIVALFVTVIDNFIRPWVLKDAGSLHPLLAFLAVFGGLKVFGAGGVILGPIVAGIFVVTIAIATEKKA